MIQLALMACVHTQHSSELASVNKNAQKYLVLVVLRLVPFLQVCTCLSLHFILFPFFRPHLRIQML